MPVQSKATWARLKVGVTAIVSLAILAMVIILITGDRSLFEGQSNLYTYLSDSAAVVEGAVVTLNGIAVGTVKKIELSGMSDPQKQVRIVMQVRSRFLPEIPADSITAISAANLLGTKFINITRGKSTQHAHDGSTLPSLNTADFEDVVKQGYAILASLDETVKKVDAIVDLIQSGKGSIGKLLTNDELYERIDDIAKQVQVIVTTLNSDKGTLGKLLYDPTLYNEVRGSLARVDSLVADVQQGNGTVGKLMKDPALYDETHKAILDLRKIMADLQAGKGTAGKLLESDQLHNQISGTIAKLDTMIDKLNAGQGTIGQLLVNPQLYDSINGSTQELHGLLKDFRANPKKFLHIKLSLF
jgi:phospholipid/cholesterol/gamma-HCH transport system substrate-binding protein